VCADGKPIVLLMLQAGRFWPHFVETIGRPDLLARFPDPSPEHSDAIREELARHFATRPREDWSVRLRTSNCIWGPLQTPLELPDDPQVQANGYLLEAGGERLCANPVQFDAAALDEARRALGPHLGSKHFGRNDFEGFRTERVYSLPALGAVFADLVEHPRILSLCDALLSPNYLLTAAQAINIHPGENAQ